MPKSPGGLSLSWVENLGRVTLTGGLTYGLSVASIPSLIPPGFSFMVGIMGGLLALVLPKQLFILGAVIPMLYTTILTVLFAASLLLCAVSVSDGFFIIIFFVYSVWCSSLFFGPQYDKTSGNVSSLTGLVGVFVLSLRPLVQQLGFPAIGMFWTEQGLENQLAINQNFLIATSWAVACVVLTTLLPPFRTMRDVLSRTIVPAALAEAATDVGLNQIEVALERKAKLVQFLNSLDNGSKAMVTLFEPRIVTAPFEACTVPKLKDLMERTEDAILASLMYMVWEEEKGNIDISPVADRIRAMFSNCATALSTTSLEHVDLRSDIAALQTQLEKDEEAVPNDTTQSSAARFLIYICSRLVDSTITWVDAMNNPVKISPTTKEGFKNLAMEYLPILLMQFITFKRLFVALLLPFQPKRWDIQSIAYGLKYSTGLILLVIISVYWEGYAKFALRQEGDFTTTAVFSGWHMVAYSNSWLPTTEGTVKKGIQRLIGACLGGFLAWLGVIVCSWSYSDDAPINPFALCAWLTVTTTAFAHLEGALDGFGPKVDWSTSGMYVVSVEALIALEVYSGLGTKGGLVTNRVVATIAGILMSALIQIIPPNVKGRDPDHARKYLTEMKSTITDLAISLKQGGYDTEATNIFEARLKKEVPNARRMALFLLNDAAQLNALPVYRVDPKLKAGLEDMIVTEAFLHLLLREAKESMSASEDATRGDPDTIASTQKEELDGILVSLIGEERAEKDEVPDSSGTSHLVGQNFPVLSAICKRIQFHESSLEKVNVSIFWSSKN